MHKIAANFYTPLQKLIQIDVLPIAAAFVSNPNIFKALIPERQKEGTQKKLSKFSVPWGKIRFYSIFGSTQYYQFNAS